MDTASTMRADLKVFRDGNHKTSMDIERTIMATVGKAGASKLRLFVQGSLIWLAF
jgi:hypothetical protein